MKNGFKVLIALAIGAVSFSSQAQIFGIKGGIGVANITSPNEFDNSRFGRTLGTKIGGTLEFELTDNLYLATGLGFAKRGASTIGDPVNLYYIETPIGARYDIFDVGRSGKFYVTSGFNIGVLLIATQSGETLEIGTMVGDQLKPLDVSFNLGPGFIFDERFEVGLLLEFGLLDIASVEQDTLRNVAIMATFGYKFGR